MLKTFYFILKGYDIFKLSNDNMLKTILEKVLEKKQKYGETYLDIAFFSSLEISERRRKVIFSEQAI